MHVPAALWNAGPRDTGGRTSGCGMLCPEILVDAPAALCERWAQGVRRKSGHLRWATNPRTGGPSDGRLCQVTPRYFLTRLVPPSRSQRSSTWCRRGLVLRPVWLDFDFALFSFTPSPFLPSSFLFLCSLTAAHRFWRIFHFGIFGPIVCGRQGVLLLPFDVDYLAHGPPRGRAAALRIWPRSTLRTRSFSLSLAT